MCRALAHQKEMGVLTDWGFETSCSSSAGLVACSTVTPSSLCAATLPAALFNQRMGLLLRIVANGQQLK